MLSRLVRALLLAATACVSVAHAEDVVFPPARLSASHHRRA